MSPVSLGIDSAVRTLRSIATHGTPIITVDCREEFKAMVCRRDSDDPIAQRLYAEKGFMLLGRGFPVSELPVGTLLRQAPKGHHREIQIEQTQAHFKNWPSLTPLSRVYSDLERSTRSSALKAEAAVDVSGTFSGSEGETASLKAALERSKITTLQVALTGAVLWTYPEATIEREARELKATSHCLDFTAQGHRLYLVTQALSVATAEIFLENELAAKAMAEGHADALADIGLTASLDSRNSASVILRRQGEEEVVIAIRCVELKVSPMGNVTGLKGASKRLNIRDDEFVPEYADLDDFAPPGELFVNIGN